MYVPQVFPWLSEEEKEEVNSVLDANWITEGPKTDEFSKQLNKLIGTEYGVFAPNGTLALFLGLLALGIGKGDEVIVPDTTFIASANAVILTGATPVFVDVCRENYQIDILKCEQVITPNTKAIMPVHLYGMIANMNKVVQFAEKYKLKIIEDAAQAIGVTYYERHAGTFGDIGCFSFFADKTITTGEGAYVVCKDKKIYERLLLLRNQGRFNRGSFIHPEVGYNFRITDIQAAIGLVQLKKLDKIIERKQKILGLYKQELKELSQIDFLKVEQGSTYVPFRVVIFYKQAQKLMQYLSERQIQTRTFFYPLHKQPCFQYLDKKQGGMLNLNDAYFENALYGYERGICLPVFPTLSEDQIRYVCNMIKEFCYVSTN